MNYFIRFLYLYTLCIYIQAYNGTMDALNRGVDVPFELNFELIKEKEERERQNGNNNSNNNNNINNSCNTCQFSLIFSRPHILPPPDQLLSLSPITDIGPFYPIISQLPRAKLQPGDPDRIIDELIEKKSDFDGSLTGTSPAVQPAINEFVSAEYTSNDILILVTDGYPNTADDPCAGSVINALDNNNIRVIIVGVGGFNFVSVECLVRGNTADIITIGNFDFASVVYTQWQAGQVVCG